MIKWNKVTEILPEVNRDVIVLYSEQTVISGIVHEVYMNRFIDNGKWLFEFSLANGELTHWHYFNPPEDIFPIFFKKIYYLGSKRSNDDPL